jgi:hypothetical protein
MMLKIFFYIAFVDEFLNFSIEQLFGGLNKLFNFFLGNRELIRENKTFFQLSVMPFLIDHILIETNIEALYIKINIFTEIFEGVYEDEDNSERDEQDSGVDLTDENPETKAISLKIYQMCLKLMNSNDLGIFSACCKLMRQLFQRVILVLDDKMNQKLMTFLCEKLNEQFEKSNKDEDEEDCSETYFINIFGLIFFTLNGKSQLIYKLLQIDLFSKIIHVLNENEAMNSDETNGLLNLTLEILYKFAKMDKLEKHIVLDSNNMIILLKYFLSQENILKFDAIYIDEVMNIIYYLTRIILLSENHEMLSLTEPVSVKKFNWKLLKLFDKKIGKNNLKIRKKIDKLKHFLK